MECNRVKDVMNANAGKNLTTAEFNQLTALLEQETVFLIQPASPYAPFKESVLRIVKEDSRYILEAKHLKEALGSLTKMELGQMLCNIN